MWGASISKTMINKRGQVWIETVTYTLVAFVLIGLVLSFAKPKIEELQDQAILEQSIKMIKEIDSVVQEIGEKGTGNKRRLEISLKKGELEINSLGDSIIFSMEGRHMYSQPGQTYQEGSINITTEEKGKYYTITMEKKYTNFNFTYAGEEENKKILRAATPYIMYISNEGGANQVIDFELE